jgi:hypothetical protein
LNIIARGRWVRPYLGCYLRLVEDDWCSIPENSPLPRHFATLEEEHIEIGAVRFERLTTVLHQGVKGMLEDVALVEVGSVGAGVSTLHT